MSYVPQVGDRVRLAYWDPDAWALVEYVGAGRWLGTTDRGVEGVWWNEGEWTKVGPPAEYPERWLNVYEDDIGNVAHISRFAADQRAKYERIGVLHLFPDGHTEMEQP